MALTMEPVKVECSFLVASPCLLVGETLRSAAHYSPAVIADAVKSGASVRDGLPHRQTSEGEGPRSSEFRPPPGLPPPSNFPSHGSVLHGTGMCKPCVWLWKPQGCDHGQDCMHCHMCPKREISERRKRRRQQKAPPKLSSPCHDEMDAATGPGSDLESLVSFNSQATPDGPPGVFF